MTTVPPGLLTLCQPPAALFLTRPIVISNGSGSVVIFGVAANVGDFLVVAAPADLSNEAGLFDTALRNLVR